MSVHENAALQAPGPLAPTRPAERQTSARDAAPTGPLFAEVLRDASVEAAHQASNGASAPKGTLGPGPAGVGGEPLHFSKHALERARRRGISLDPATIGRLREGVGRVAGKSARDSLVLVDGTAFVVSVNNRTVITAVGSRHMREHVFTNIDSAVIA